MFENSQDPESELEYGKIKQEHEINDLKDMVFILF